MRTVFLALFASLIGCSSPVGIASVIAADAGRTDAKTVSDGDAGAAIDSAVTPDAGEIDSGHVDAGSDAGETDASDAGAPVTATVAGWPVADARASHPSPGTFTVDILDTAATCDVTNDDHKAGPGTRVLRLYFYAPGGDPSIGTYKVNPMGLPQLNAELLTHDVACGLTVERDAGDGSVTYTAIKGDRVTGSFNVTINGAKIEGTFDAPTCAAGSDAGAPVCL